MLTRRVLRRLPVPSRPGNKLIPANIASTLCSRRHLATAPSTNDAFANGTNAYYADEMYRLWKHDSKSVHSSWDVYFSGLDKGLSSSQAFQPPPSLPHPADGAPALHVGKGAELDDHLKVSTIIVFHFRSLIKKLGPITRPSIPSSRPPRRRVRPFGNFRCRFG